MAFCFTLGLLSLVAWASIVLGDPVIELLLETEFTRTVVAGAGDLNADGYADFAASDPSAGESNSERGEVYIYHGGPNADDVPDLILSGPVLFDRIGWSLAGPGDINGDGFDDLLVGAPESGNTDAGKVLVYFGGPAMDNSADLVIFGDEDNRRLGAAVSGIGDFDGDGFRDFALGGDGDLSGKVYIHHGGPGLDEVPEQTRESFTLGFGTSIAGPGDLNGDGFSDLVLGLPGNVAARGAIQVLFGPSPGSGSDLYIEGLEPGLRFGWTVAGAGDLNGDGFPDVAVATHDASVQTRRTYVYFGGTAMDATVDLSFLDGQSQNGPGRSVDSAGDVNGDGYDDLVIGTHGLGVMAEGQVSVYYGGPNLDALADLRTSGRHSDDGLGAGVAGVGDFDGDGLADFAAVGANRVFVYSLTPFELLEPNGGERWVTGKPARVRWHGVGLADVDLSVDGGLTFTRVVEGATSPGSIEILVPDVETRTAILRVRENDFTISVETMRDQSDAVFTIGPPHDPPTAAYRHEQTVARGTTPDQYGYVVDGIEDFNGDGFPDYIVGAWRDDTGNAYVHFGGPEQDDRADLILTGEVTSDFFGFSVAGAGDFNGDGFADAIVGAPFNGGQAGRSYLYHGGPNANAGTNLVFDGEALGDQFGIAGAGIGDANGDGFDDLLLGAPKHGDLDEGRAYLHFGGPTADTVADLTYTGIESSGQLGQRVAGGDINGDGLADLLMTATADGPDGAGSVHVRFGRRVLASPGPVPDLQLHAEGANDDFGLGLAFAGDVNGDGFGDFLVGAPDAANFYGRVYLYLGGRAPDGFADLIFEGTRNFSDFGASVAGAGDVNGDGYEDIVIGAPGDDPGRVFVFYGGPGMDTHPDAILQGVNDNDATGTSVAIVGDTRGDGFDDLLIGSPKSITSTDPGRAELLDWNRYFVLTPTSANDWAVGASETVSWLGAETADLWLSADGGDSYSRLRTGVGGSSSNLIVVDVPDLPSQSVKLRLTPVDSEVGGSAGSHGLFAIVPPHPDPWWHLPVETTGDIGSFTSLALGASGRPYVAYYDEGNGDLRLAVREGAGWRTEVVDSAGDVGLHSSLAAGDEGDLHVSYLDLTNQKLKYASNTGDGWVIEQPVPSTDAGFATSLVLDRNGRPHLAFDSASEAQVWYVTKVAGDWIVEAVGVSAYGASLALNSEDLPGMAYAGSFGGDVRFTQKDRRDIWTEEVIDLAEDTVRGFSVAFDANDQPHVCWLDTQYDEVRYATRTNGKWQVDIIAVTGFVNAYTSLSIDSQGRPHVTYCDFGPAPNRGLYHAVKRGDQWVIEKIDGTGDRLYPSAQLDDQDNARIAYFDQVNKDLRYASQAIELRSPAPGLVWPVGASRRIGWDGSGRVDLSLSVDGGETWELLADGISTSGYALTVPHVPTRYAQVRLQRRYPWSEARSDSLFSIESSILLEAFRSSVGEDGAIVLQWQTTPGPDDLAGYVLERAGGSGVIGATGTTGASWETLADGIRETSYLDRSPAPGARYRLSGRNGLGEELVLGEIGAPLTQALSAWPQPFRNGDLQVRFRTASGLGGAAAPTEVGIYDPSGRRIRQLVEGEYEAGLHATTWDGRDDRGGRVASGVYFLRVISAGQGEERKLVVLR